MIPPGGIFDKSGGDTVSRAEPLHSAWMDPRDHLRALLDGMACTVCDAPVPAERIQLLARRDEMTFVQIQCAACGSTGLGFLSDDAFDEGTARPSDPVAPPVTADEVLDMHEFLAGWDGDARGLLDDLGGDRSPDQRNEGWPQ
jgi:hypothetical protein